MAAGAVGTKEVSDTLNGNSKDSTTLTPTSGSRICGVTVKYAAPEVSLTGVVSDSTGDNVTVYFDDKGPGTNQWGDAVTHPVTLTVFEVTDA